MEDSVKSSLNSEIVSVKGEDLKIYPASTLFIIISLPDIPRSSDKIKADSSGGHSLSSFEVQEQLLTRTSWEKIGIAKGKLPSTLIRNQNGIEKAPYMTLNGYLFTKFFRLQDQDKEATLR